MNKSITTEVREELLLRDLRRHLGLGNFLKLALAYGVLAGAVVAIAFAFGEGAGQTALVVVAVVAVLASAYYWFLVRLGIRSFSAALAKLPHRRQTYTFTDDQILVEGPIGHSRLTWDMLEKIESTKDLWRLHFLSSYYPIPSELIDQELASFLEGKARERGVEVHREGVLPAADPGQETGGPTTRRRRLLSSLIFWGVVIIPCLVLAVYWPLVDSRRGARSVSKHFVVKPGDPQVMPLGIRQGESLDLSVVVTSGAAVDVSIGLKAVFEENNIIIKSAGLPEARQVRNYRQQHQWRHPGPATIMVTSEGRSEVSLWAEVSRNP